jgi:hypothetical protein
MAEKEVELGLQFIIPTEYILGIARRLLASPNQDERDVAKAVLDTTQVASTSAG